MADTELGVRTVSNNCPHEVTTLWRKQTVSNARSLVIPIAMGAHRVGTKISINLVSRKGFPEQGMRT